MPTLHWTCSIEPSGRTHPAGSWQCHLERGLLRVSQTGHVNFYMSCPFCFVDLWCPPHCVSATQLLFVFQNPVPCQFLQEASPGGLRPLALTSLGIPIRFFRVCDLWDACYVLSGFIINFMYSGPICFSVPLIPHLIVDILVLSSEAYAIMRTKLAFHGLQVRSDLHSYLLLEGE